MKPVTDKKSHKRAMDRIDALMDLDPPEGSEEADELEALAVLVNHYERKLYPAPKVDPIDALVFRMDQLGLSRKDLEPYIGSRGRVAEVLNKNRKLSINMIRKLHEGLNIPAETLIGAAM